MQHLSTYVLCLLLAFTVFTVTGGAAQAPSAPLSTILARDGAIKSDTAGSFDPRSYRLSYSSNGAPRLIAGPQPAGGCIPDAWDTTFTTNGANGQVYTIVSDGAGNIYIGGSFTSVQGVAANRIAKWDGTAWTGLGTGIAGTAVRSIAFLGSDVYVGGDFALAGGLPARNVAKWNGSSWSALSTGLGGGTHIVNALAVYNNEVYASGGFNTLDGSPTNGTARWNGTVWTSVGTDAPGAVSLVVNNGAIFAPTYFGGIMKWDGSTWSTITGLTGVVNSIAFMGTDLFAVGSLNVTGSGGANVAKWNGSTWTRLGSFGNSVVETVAVVGSDVYVGGHLPTPVNMFNNIAKLNGTTWTGVGQGLVGGDDRVHILTLVGDTLYAGGDFTTAGGSAARNIAKLAVPTSTWSSFLGTGIDAPSNAIAVLGNDVYIGGSFTSAGPLAANRIARWNTATNTWSALGSGVSGPGTENSSISAIAVAGGKVYAGGSFPRIGGVTANNIAVWNGTSWAPLGTGVNGTVYAIVARGDDIYVGGAFQTAGGVTANRVAKWNGSTWAGLDSAILPNTVVSMAFKGDDLYVGIPTTTVANPAYFSKYDGSAWTPLGAELGDRGVSSVAVLGTDVYVAGGFTTIAGTTVNRIAKWNGLTWSPLGSGLPSPTGQFGGVRLTVSGNELIAIGDFTTAGGSSANRVAKWNGSVWSPLGAGVNSPPSTVTVAGGDIFVGGAFTTAGCNVSPYFARWRETVWTGSTSTDWHTTTNWGGGSVPPSNASVTISSNNASITSADVTLSSLIVTGGRSLTIGAGRTLTVNGTLDVSGGTIAGPGSLIVSDLNLTGGGTVTGTGSIVVNGNLYLGLGMISGGSVSVTSCRPGAIAGGNASSFIASPVTRCVNSSGTYRFPVGTDGIYAPVELANISGNGNFTVDPRSGPHPGAAGLPNNRLQRWWEFTNSGIAQADITFTYSDTEVVGLENWYRVYRISGVTATQLPTAINATANRVTVTGVSSFPAWTLAEGQPVPLWLSGRVTRPSGRGAAGVLLSLTDDQGNTRYTMTNPFGYYSFPNVLTFRMYTVGVTSKRYTFSPPQRSVPFDEFTAGVNFVSSDY